jgi:hypothetical protein
MGFSSQSQKRAAGTPLPRLEVRVIIAIPIV